MLYPNFAQGADPPPGRASPRRDGSANARPCVLLAEDDEDSRDLLSITLEGDGYDVTSVVDGGRLLVCIARDMVAPRAVKTYDLMVFDIRMPVCSGLQILEQLRKASCSTPAIIVTGFSDAGVRGHVEALGGLLFEKPLDLGALRAAARHLIGHQ